MPFQVNTKLSSMWVIDNNWNSSDLSGLLRQLQRVLIVIIGIPFRSLW